MNETVYIANKKIMISDRLLFSNVLHGYYVDTRRQYKPNDQGNMESVVINIE